MDAAAVLRSVAQSMSLKAVRYGCAIRFDGEESLPILGREERVRQLCINLIDNAIKYGAPGRPSGPWPTTAAAAPACA